MRPKFVITILLAGAAVLTVLLFLKPSNHVPQPAPVVGTQPAAALPETNFVAPQVAAPATVTTVSTPPLPVKPLPFTIPAAVGDGAEVIQAQIDRLQELQANDDDASLQAILKELTNTNALVRHAAIEATIQFGGHTAVPVLQGLAARTWDPAEKQELLDAAEFLALPTMSEVRAENAGVKIMTPQNPSPAPGQP